MTIPWAHANEDLQGMLLRFIGAFSHIQSTIDEAIIKGFLLQKMPKAAAVIGKQITGRIRDDERLQVFAAIAVEVETDAELSEFNAVFRRVKKLRDSAAHAARVTVRDDQLLIDQTLYLQGAETEPESVVITRSELSQALVKCSWLQTQLLYVSLATNNVVEANVGGGNRLEFLKPTRKPEDWDGVVWRVLGPSSKLGWPGHAVPPSVSD